MSNWYKALVAKLTLLAVMPELEHELEVCRLDAERERLAKEYLVADGALLRQIAKHLNGDGSGRWSNYIARRIMPGVTTPHERMKLARGINVDVVRFDRSAVHDLTHCRDCGRLGNPKCDCAGAREVRDGDSAD